MSAPRPLLQRHLLGTTFGAVWGAVGFTPAFLITVVRDSWPFQSDIGVAAGQIVLFSLVTAIVVAMGFGIGIGILGVPLQAVLRRLRLDGVIPALLVGAVAAMAPAIILMPANDLEPFYNVAGLAGLALGGALAGRAYREATLKP